MTVLGLDLALKTGWAVAEDGKLIDSGVIDFSHSRDDGHNGHLFLSLWREASVLMREYCVDMVRVELAHHRGGASTRIALGMLAAALMAAAACKCRVATIHTTTLKKLWTGDGKASKRMMMDVSSKLLNRPLIDDNESDAIALAASKGVVWSEHEGL